MKAARGLVLGSLIALTCAGTVFACVGDDPTTPDTNIIVFPEAGTSSSSSSSSSGGGTGDGGGGNCTGSTTKCGDVCADTTTSSDHCGACGHSCGGGECTNSTCGAASIVPLFNNPYAFAIDGTSVYYTAGSLILSCPLAGCGGQAPKQIASLGDTGAALLEVSTNGFIYFSSPVPNSGSGNPLIWVCPIAGCPGTLPPGTSNTQGSHYALLVAPVAADASAAGTDDVFNSAAPGIRMNPSVTGTFGASVSYAATSKSRGLAVDANYIYFADTNTASPSNLGLVKCDRFDPTCPKVALTNLAHVSTDNGNVFQLSAFKGAIYTNGISMNGGNAIWVCPSSGCQNQKLFVESFDRLRDMTVDDSGVYWSAKSDFVNTPEKLQTCPLAGCSSGVKSLYSAPPQTQIMRVRSDASFIYWFEITPTDAGSFTYAGQIKRIAKPL